MHLKLKMYYALHMRRAAAQPAKDMMLFLVWDEESEEHLDKTILGNNFQSVDSGPERKNQRKMEDASSSSEEELTGFGADGGSSFPLVVPFSW